jgi:hypothetical protein
MDDKWIDGMFTVSHCCHVYTKRGVDVWTIDECMKESIHDLFHSAALVCSDALQGSEGAAAANT